MNGTKKGIMAAGAMFIASLMILGATAEAKTQKKRAGKAKQTTQKAATRAGRSNAQVTHAATAGGSVGEAIDLGLSVKWASHNIGATKPSDYGCYFSWGETKPKSSYTEREGVGMEVPYSSLQAQGIVDAAGNLTPAHDAATVNWGASWRMPTVEELKELLERCTWDWTAQDGKNGYNVTGPNGNSIFLPAAGGQYSRDTYDTGTNGWYWSATANVDGGEFYYLSYDLAFSEKKPYGEYNDRFYGQTVRPVSE